MFESTLTEDESTYIGKFLIEIYVAVSDFKDIYGKDPASVAVDSEHYNLIKASAYDGWVDKETMTLNNGVKIVEETRWDGSYTSVRGTNYKEA